MVRFPDIDEDLVGIEQVIYGDGVEARSKFLEKEEFDKKEENLDEANNEKGAQEKPAMPAGAKPAVGDDKHPCQQRDGFHQRYKEIAMEAAQQGAKKVGER